MPADRKSRTQLCPLFTSCNFSAAFFFFLSFKICSSFPACSLSKGDCRYSHACFQTICFPLLLTAPVIFTQLLPVLELTGQDGGESSSCVRVRLRTGHPRMCSAAAVGSCLPKARKGGFTPAQGAHCAAEGGLCSRRSPSAAHGAGRRSASVPAVDVCAHVPVPTCMHTHTCTHVSPSSALLQSPLSSAQCAQLFPHQCQGCVEAQHRPAVLPRPPTPLGRAPGATAAWLAWATMQILSSLSVTLTGNRCRPSPACGDPAPAGAEQQVVPLLPCPAHLCVLVHPCPCPRSSGCCAVGWCCPHPQHAVGKRQLPPLLCRLSASLVRSRRYPFGNDRPQGCAKAWKSALVLQPPAGRERGFVPPAMERAP